MIAVWVFISDSSRLTHRGVWIYSETTIWRPLYLPWLLAVGALACYEEDAFVEAADHWDFGLGLLLGCGGGSNLNATAG